jgi:hypothetical protein
MAPLRDRPIDPRKVTWVVAFLPHGPLSGDATEPAWNGYLLTVACSCGVVFERWVTPEDADRDLLMMARQN